MPGKNQMSFTFSRKLYERLETIYAREKLELFEKLDIKSLTGFIAWKLEQFAEQEEKAHGLKQKPRTASQ